MEEALSYSDETAAHVHGSLVFLVAPLVDLLTLKLNSLRPKDLVHFEILDEVGLITPEIERKLPRELWDRSEEARTQFEHNGNQEQE